MPFYYSGCEGNANRFVTQEACELDCPPDIGKIYTYFYTNNRKKCILSRLGTQFLKL